MLKKYRLFGLAMVCCTPAFAQQAAHVHGVASMNLAYEGEELQIEFVSPADGIVGFEYEPSTDAERKAVEDAIAALRNPQSLFALPGNAGCELHEVEVERHAEDDHDEHGHDEHGHDKHAHDEHGHDDHGHDKHAHEEHKHDDHGHDEHDHDKHAHDEHGHDDHGHGEEMHSEFHAHYHFDCDGSAIKEIQLTLFKNFPRIETLQLQALAPGGQTGGNINASNPVIRLP